MIGPEEYERWEHEKTANAKQVGGAHYVPGEEFQHWDWAVENNLSYLEGTLTKYVVRHKSKAGRVDLEKTLHYAEKLYEVRSKSGPHILQWRPKVMQGLEKMTALYRLTEKETEVLRLAAEYGSLADLKALVELTRQLYEEAPRPATEFYRAGK